MQLNITKDTTLRELKKQFAKQFPNLTLEFYPESRKKNEKVAFFPHGSEQEPFGLITRWRQDGAFAYEDTTTVFDFEERMKRKFGLPLQVFRKSDEGWMETRPTNKWSLGKQNAVGAVAGRPFRFNVHSLFL